MLSLVVHVAMLALPGLEPGGQEKQIREWRLYATLSLNHHEPDGSLVNLPDHHYVPAKSKVSTDTPGLITQPKVTPDEAHAQFDSAPPSEPIRGLPKASTTAESEPSGDGADDISLYFRSSLLDRPPVPHSAPNPRKYLSTTPISTLPIILRLYIDKSGKVLEIDVRTMETLDDSQVTPVKDMFFATSFIPGNIKGVDVPSYIDIEVKLSEYIR